LQDAAHATVTSNLDSTAAIRSASGASPKPMLTSLVATGGFALIVVDTIAAVTRNATSAQKTENKTIVTCARFSRGYVASFSNTWANTTITTPIAPTETCASVALGLVARGEREVGLSMFREAFRLNPYHPEWYWVDFGSALFVCERYEEAIESFSHRRDPYAWVLSRIAACYAQLDRMTEAKAVVEKIMKKAYFFFFFLETVFFRVDFLTAGFGTATFLLWSHNFSME